MIAAASDDAAMTHIRTRVNPLGGKRSHLRNMFASDKKKAETINR
jgi:hypothetical protein